MSESPRHCEKKGSHSQQDLALDDCFSQGFYSCTNIMTKKQVGEERVYLVYTFHQRKSGLELEQVRKQELVQKPWRDAPYWLASPVLLSLDSRYRTQDFLPRDGTIHKGPSTLDH